MDNLRKSFSELKLVPLIVLGALISSTLILMILALADPTSVGLTYLLIATISLLTLLINGVARSSDTLKAKGPVMEFFALFTSTLLLPLPLTWMSTRYVYQATSFPIKPSFFESPTVVTIFIAFVFYSFYLSIFKAWFYEPKSD